MDTPGVLGARGLRIHFTHHSPVSPPFPRPLLGHCVGKCVGASLSAPHNQAEFTGRLLQAHASNLQTKRSQWEHLC